MRRLQLRFVVSCLIVGVCFSLANGADAQDQTAPRNQATQQSEPSAEELGRAREHHQGALDALESGNLEAAEDGFRAALSLAPRASSAFNLALVLIDRLQYVEAIVLLRSLERGRYGEAPVPAEELLAHRRLAEEGVATLHLDTEAREPIEVVVNERPSGSVSAGRGLRLRLDPGFYEVRGASVQIEALDVRLGSGEQARHRVALAAAEAPSRRGLIIGLSVAAVLVAAAAGLTVALIRRDGAGELPVVHALSPGLFGPR